MNLISLVVVFIFILPKLVKIFSSANDFSIKEQKEPMKQSKTKQENNIGIRKRATYSNQVVEEDTNKVYEEIVHESIIDEKELEQKNIQEIKQEKPTPKKYPKKQVKHKEHKKEERMRQLVLEKQKQLEKQEEQVKNQDERYETIFGAYDFDEVNFLDIDLFSLCDTEVEVPDFRVYREQEEKNSIYEDSISYEEPLE